MPQVKLGDVAVESRETYKGDKTGVPIVGLEHLTPGEVTLSNWDTDTDNTFTKRFRKGDMLFGRRRAYLKKAAQAPFDGICSGDITVIRAKENQLRPELLPFIIQNDTLFDFAVGKSAGSLSPRVKWDNLKNYTFELPTMNEQKKLAEVLWSINDTLQAYQNLLTQTDALVQARFEETIVNSGWPSIRLEELCDSIVRGPFGSALKVSCFVNKTFDTVKVYEQKNAIQCSARIGDSYVTKEKYQELKRFECGPGDFIMSCSGTIGCLYQLPENAEKGIINQALCKFHLNGKLLPSLFFTYMRYSVDQLEIKGSAMKNIGAVSYLKNMEIPLPPIPEQKNLDSFISQANKSKMNLQNTITSLQATKRCILETALGNRGKE